MPPIITAWRDEADLILVGKYFYQKATIDGKDPRVEACERVHIWKARGDIPHSVFATSSLVQAILHDEHSISSQPEAFSAPILFHTVASTYAIALIQFVTGICDTEQTKRDRLTMYRVAESIGLSHAFVDLRNDIVHGGKLPLAQLRESVEHALEWLWRNYWKDVISRDRAEEEDNSSYEALLALEQITVKLESIIGDFARFVREQRMPETRTDVDIMDRKTTFYANKLQKLCENQSQDLTLFADLLTSEAEFQQSTNATPESCIIHDCWDKLLLEVAKIQPNFLLAFSNAIVRDLTTQVSTGSQRKSNETLSAWLTHPWLSEHWQPTRKHSKIQGEDVLGASLASPNQWTLTASETILRKCEHEISDAAAWWRRIDVAKRSSSNNNT